MGTDEEPPKRDPAILRKLIEVPFAVGAEEPGGCCPTEDGPKGDDAQGGEP
jgi:hypothetical protein